MQATEVKTDSITLYTAQSRTRTLHGEFTIKGRSFLHTGITYTSHNSQSLHTCKLLVTIHVHVDSGRTWHTSSGGGKQRHRSIFFGWGGGRKKLEKNAKFFRARFRAQKSQISNFSAQSARQKMKNCVCFSGI